MTTTTIREQQKPAAGPDIPWRQVIGLVLAVTGLFLPQMIQFPGLSPAAGRMLGIFIMAVTLWITEAVPMHATAVLVILLEILCLSDGAIFKLADTNYKPMPVATLFASLSHPVIILFLGGFFLADGACKFGLDKSLSALVLRPFGTRPKMVLLGLMLITAIFSMFMSNTATTATMMTVALPVMAMLPKGDRFRAAIALSIPVAANIGGIGTPIGTPPNAIALAALSAQKVPGIPTFMQWTMGATPFMLVFLAIGWTTLVMLFPCKEKEIKLDLSAKFDKSGPAMIFYATFLATVVLWMTEELQKYLFGVKLDSNIVGFIPVVVLLCTKVFTVKDLQSLEWHVLWLVAGGIALGVGIDKTGMGAWFVGLFSWDKMNPFTLVALLTAAALFVGTFISHSATTNLLVPLVIPLAMSKGVKVDVVAAAIFVAIGSSLAMALPISTPPNAIAFATGEVKQKDMAIVGAIIGVLGWTIFVLLGPLVWRAMGIIK